MIPETLLLYKADTDRKCGRCSLCCKLLPMPELKKPANTPCRYQRFGKGCTVYARRPLSCQTWSCRWLLGVDTGDMPRPDHCHYVIDPIPDFVRMVNQETGELQVNVEVVQVWLDPGFPDAHRDPALRRYLLRRGDENVAALIRLNGQDAFALFPPQMAQGEWREVHAKNAPEGQHSLADFFAAQQENKAMAAKREPTE